MGRNLRGADVVVRTLARLGTKNLFTLSGNQIMPIFDASIDAGVELYHVRHEAAAVHMADAWGRLSGDPGVALVTAEPGFANTLSALYVATMAESPLVLLSGDAPVSQSGRGAFQEMAQAEMAAPVTKASWTAASASELPRDVARAHAIAGSRRPGPVHLGVPVDLLESTTAGDTEAPSLSGEVQDHRDEVDGAGSARILGLLREARTPLVIAGPAMMRGARRAAVLELEDATGMPAVFTESPRGINDPSLGAFAEVLAKADLVLLAGKKLDFTVGFGAPPSVGSDCRFIQIDPEPSVIDQTRRALDDDGRLAFTATVDPEAVVRSLVELSAAADWPVSGWRQEVEDAVSYRPVSWSEVGSTPSPDSGRTGTGRTGPLHPVEVCRAIQDELDDATDSVFVSDGGEFGQWAHACITAPERLINGPSGAIGSAIPFAVAAALARPGARVIATLGDGTFGFHALEFDTAVRYGAQFVAVVGNDATWNAEYQIQLRDYGRDRLIGCELLPSRYDQVATALGGYGAHVDSPSELRPALRGALASGQPACVNVRISRQAAPAIRRPRA